MSPVLLWLLYGGTALFAFGAAAVRARDLARDPGNHPLRALVHVAWSLGAVLILVLVAPFLDALHGFQSLGSTVWHILTLWAAYQFLRFLLYSSLDEATAARRARRRGGAFAVAMLVIVLAYGAADAETRSHGFRVADHGLAAAAWQLVFLLGLAWALGDGARLALAYAPRAPYRDLRISLRLLGAGSVAGLAFCAAKILTAAIQISGIGEDVVPGSILVVLVAATILLIFAGALWPGTAARIRAMPTWLARRQRHRALWRLWNDMRRDFAELVYGRVPTRTVGDALRARHLSWRHYRRVIEIDDMLLELKPWQSPHIEEHVRQLGHNAGLDGDDLDALVHAAVINAALAAKHAGDPPADARDTGVLAPTTCTRLDDEARWLVRVQQARTSPLLSSTPVTTG